MWPYHPELLARPVPRYTSYPTAAEFCDGVGHDDMAAALDAIDANADVSLYLHIPYCRAICWYCGCNTAAANRTARLDAYMVRLHAEIDRVAARLDGRGRIGRIAFGGGSPNAIGPDAFAALVAHLRTAFACRDAPLSLEIDPRGFAPDWASVIAETGVTRVSLGVQTFDPMLQAAIGRVQPRADIIRAVTLLRRAGVGSINFDLMYGLPGQTDAALQATLDETIALAPERLAVFGYAHVPHLIPRQRRIDATALPDAAARFADDPADILIGLGASAISAFPDRLLQNAKNTGEWHRALGANRFATVRGIRRTPLDQRRGAAIAGVLCHGVADTDGLPERDAIRIRLSRFEKAGLLRWEGHRLRLKADALPYARSIAAAFDAWRSEDDTRFSHAV
jgi:oxygen-independent coproporphyrinogen-3 oxidase